tara:strand:+ start:536 stop:931 length:396 start_codon:yes stop_codon:yes gene_type:complete
MEKEIVENEMEWADKSSIYNGKELGANIWLDKDTVLKCTLTYMDEVIEGKRRWEWTPAEMKNRAYEIRLGVCKMKRSYDMFSGGLGEWKIQKDTRTKRRSLKGLKDHAKMITEAHCRAIGEPQNTNPSILT